jgi:hypothetical protein
MAEGPKASCPEPEASEREAYEGLQFYTLAHGDSTFVHQYVVDAWTAQHADEHTKPIALTFALVGLHLHVDRHFTGRQVQRIHMALARRKHPWPAFTLPAERGTVRAPEVLAAPPGPERDRAIDAWCTSVWGAFGENRNAVLELLRLHGVG